MNTLSLSLFGQLQITSAGAPVTAFESAKARALLVYHAVESARAHRREALATLRAYLSPGDLADAESEGRRLSLDAALAFADPAPNI